MCHYASDKSCGDFSLKMQLNEFGYPQISWLDLRGDGIDKEKTEGKGIAVGGGQKKERSQREAA